MSSAGPGLPEHEQRAWDAIVADLSGQIDLGPEFSAPPSASPAGSAEPGEIGEIGEIAASLAAPDEPDTDEPDDRYVPPHPPPIPRPSDAIGRFSWGAVLGGPLLVLLVTILGLDRWLANLGVVMTVGGFVSLVWRMNDREDDGDDGAVV